MLWKTAEKMNHKDIKSTKMHEEEQQIAALTPTLCRFVLLVSLWFRFLTSDFGVAVRR